MRNETKNKDIDDKLVESRLQERVLGFGDTTLKMYMPSINNFLDKTINRKRYEGAMKLLISMNEKNPRSVSTNIVKAAGVWDVDHKNLRDMFNDATAKNESGAGEWGTDQLTKNLKKGTPNERTESAADPYELVQISESAVVTKIKRLLKRLNWESGSRSPKELQSQIRDLDDDTLTAWSKDSSGFGTGETVLQNKIVRQEVKRRGLSESYYSNYNQNSFKNRERNAGLDDEEERYNFYKGSGSYTLKIDGKPLKGKDGELMKWSSFSAAEKAARTMMAKPFNKGKQFTVVK